MLVVDYILAQQDKHMSNMALKNGYMYPLFDNGECLGIGTIGEFSKNFERHTLLNKNRVIKLFSRTKLINIKDTTDNNIIRQRLVVLLHD